MKTTSTLHQCKAVSSWSCWLFVSLQTARSSLAPGTGMEMESTSTALFCAHLDSMQPNLGLVAEGDRP